MQRDPVHTVVLRNSGCAFGMPVDSISLHTGGIHVITQEGVGTMVSQAKETAEIVRAFARVQAVKATKPADEEMEKGEFLTVTTPPKEPELGVLG